MRHGPGDVVPPASPASPHSSRSPGQPAGQPLCLLGRSPVCHPPPVCWEVIRYTTHCANCDCCPTPESGRVTAPGDGLDTSRAHYAHPLWLLTSSRLSVATSCRGLQNPAAHALPRSTELAPNPGMRGCASSRDKELCCHPPRLSRQKHQRHQVQVYVQVCVGE